MKYMILIASFLGLALAAGNCPDFPSCHCPGTSAESVKMSPVTARAFAAKAKAASGNLEVTTGIASSGLCRVATSRV
ncbi:hypothetical protein N7509_004757 [Penicillium cosmopolitanum]|uniref:Uncharacterized protein n=1 Tax=Penicillium cosmopolitanum TaxID=1131564 RepID=A0A9W9W0X9_9EURO|nr:uncharacterized protein N7509_004757 [Penicillium cosmopolitanum]KAJ5396644.1 hypothetical protein N7509_004757 [Penicillium cosmopolitanum]